MNKEYIVVKDREKQKYSAGDIWKIMQKEGYKNFKQYQHTKLWQSQKAKDPSRGFGVEIVRTWYWYDLWLSFVRNHCKQNKPLYI